MPPHSTAVIIRWGSFRIHDYFFARLLEKCGVKATFAIYTPHHAYGDEVSKEIYKRVQDSFEVVEIRCGSVARQLIRFSTLIHMLSGFVVLPWFLGAFTDRKMRAKLSGRKFDFHFAIEHPSLYLASKVIAEPLRNLLYYSLEITGPAETGVSRTMKSLIRYQDKMLAARVSGLLIQDKFRAAALLQGLAGAEWPELGILPVNIDGKKQLRRSGFFEKRLGLDPKKRVALYFGSVYGDERKIDSLCREFEKSVFPDRVLVLHGSHEFRQMLPKDTLNIRVSEQLVPMDSLDEVVSSCDIGIALYDQRFANTRLTAFASEKITRYLQCGKPFVAFRNESTESLRNLSCCCELITDITELNDAITRIMSDYDSYAQEAWRAYDEFFDQDALVPPLKKFLVATRASQASAVIERFIKPVGPQKSTHSVFI